MIPRFKPSLGFEELRAAFSWQRKEDVTNFEKAFAELMGQNFALAFPYGRTGLIILLEALAISGKEIICPAYTCVVVPHAIVYSGNTPVFVDCKSGEFNMDLDQAEKKITQNTGAFIATSLFGYPVDLDKLDKIRANYPHIKIIQDCAHSFSAKWKGRSVQNEGVAALFGLNISKIITSIFGGMITTNDKKIYQKMKNIRNQKLIKPSIKKNFRRLLYFMSVYPTFYRAVYNVVNRIERVGLLNHFVKYFDESKIDMPVDYLEGMCGIEARVGIRNIDRYDELIKKRRSASNHYFKHLANISGVRLPPKTDGATYSHFVIRVHNREKWLKIAIKMGVQLGWLIEYNIPEMVAYGEHRPEEFPVAAKYARTTVNLPVWGGEKIGKEILKNVSFRTSIL